MGSYSRSRQVRKSPDSQWEWHRTRSEQLRLHGSTSLVNGQDHQEQRQRSITLFLSRSFVKFDFNSDKKYILNVHIIFLLKMYWKRLIGSEVGRLSQKVPLNGGFRFPSAPRHFCLRHVLLISFLYAAERLSERLVVVWDVIFVKIFIPRWQNFMI